MPWLCDILLALSACKQSSMAYSVTAHRSRSNGVGCIHSCDEEQFTPTGMNAVQTNPSTSDTATVCSRSAAYFQGPDHTNSQHIWQVVCSF